MHLSNLEISEFEKYLNRFNFNEYIKNKTILITGAKGIIGGGKNFAVREFKAW